MRPRITVHCPRLGGDHPQLCWCACACGWLSVLVQDVEEARAAYRGHLEQVAL